MSYLGHVLSDLRHGLIAAACVTEATTRSEREAAAQMIEQTADAAASSIQVAADKAYDEIECVRRLAAMLGNPARDASILASDPAPSMGAQRATGAMRKTSFNGGILSKIFGWLKQIGGQRRTRFRGRQRVGWMLPTGRGRLQSDSHDKPGIRRQTCLAEGARRATGALQHRKPAVQTSDSPRLKFNSGLGLPRFSSSSEACATL